MLGSVHGLESVPGSGGAKSQYGGSGHHEPGYTRQLSQHEGEYIRARHHYDEERDRG